MDRRRGGGRGQGHGWLAECGVAHSKQVSLVVEYSLDWKRHCIDRRNRIESRGKFLGKIHRRGRDGGMDAEKDFEERRGGREGM